MTPREFAIQVVEKLQSAGHEALWAGGCVRDQMVGRTPKDYDVATSALPEVVREIFGKKRTLAIGASFGVITVLGPKAAVAVRDAEGIPTCKTETIQHAIEIATFRRDGGYSDGRRPDGVEYTDAREDALRRDYTINGMFFDPIKEEVIDFVGGKADLSARQIRAIGDPNKRIEEDKLRMLRGVRFASTFGFELEVNTLKAIQLNANEINVVSGERIGAEMRRMLAGPNRAHAIELLRLSELLPKILPMPNDAQVGDWLYWSDSQWTSMLGSLKSLELAEFSCAATILLEPIVEAHGVDAISDRWKLSNEEKKTIRWVCKNRASLEQAVELRWSVVQPLLLSGEVERALAVCEACNRIKPVESVTASLALCRERLGWDGEKLNPQPFLGGGDLMELGIEQGPKFKEVLMAVRRAQLDGEINSVEEARLLAKQI